MTSATSLTVTWNGKAGVLQIKPDGGQVPLPTGAVITITCDDAEPFDLDHDGEVPGLSIWCNARLVRVTVV